MKSNVNKKVVVGLLIGVILLVGLSAYLFGGNMDEFTTRIPEVEKSQYMDHGEDKRDLRYGEIIPVFRKGAKLYVEVYNTMESNELPEDLWQNLDADEMKEEYGAMTVILNGPRYWVLNDIYGEGKTSEGKVANFGGIEMTQRAALKSNIFSGTVGDKLYEDNVVNRETTYEFWKGNMVYELTSPEGHVYRMQSYSQHIDPTLTIEDLETLGSRLDMPEGWQYNARVLEKDSVLKTNGEGYIINDEFGNTYQRLND